MMRELFKSLFYRLKVEKLKKKIGKCSFKLSKPIAREQEKLEETVKTNLSNKNPSLFVILYKSISCLT